MKRVLSVVLSLVFLLSAAVSMAQSVAAVSIAQTNGTDTICVGSTVAFTATPINGGSSPTYHWYVNGASVTGVTGPLYSTNSLALGTPYVYCTMTSNLSGVVGSPATSNIIYLKVNPLPTGTLSGTTNICPGDTAMLTLRFTGTRPYSGLLSDSTSFTSVYDTLTIFVSPDTTTTYRILSLSDNALCSAGSLSGSAVVTLRSRPSASDSGMASVCAGSSTNVTITATGTAPFHGTLSNGTNFTGTSSVFTVPVTPTADTTYVITSFNDAHCRSLASALTDSTVLYVIPRPVAMISDSDSICSGQMGHITFAIQTGAPWVVNYSGGSLTYTTVVASSPLTIYTSPTTTTSYHLTSVSGGGCSTRASDLSGMGLIVVSPTPIPNITALTDSSLCLANNIFNFNGSRSTVSSGSITHWNWDFGSLNPDTASGPQPRVHFLDTVTNQKVTLTLISNKGCVSDTSIYISVRPSPLPSFTLSASDLCMNSTLTVHAIADSGNSYNWNWGTTADTCFCDSITHSFASINDKRIHLTVTDIKGCSDTSSQTVHIHALPQVAFTIADTVECFKNNNFIFTDHSSLSNAQIYGDALNSYSWDFGDQTARDPSTFPAHTYHSNTLNSYTVTEHVFTNFGCEDSAQRSVLVFKTPTIHVSNSIGSDTICANTSYILTALSDAQRPIYVWSTGDSTASISRLSDTAVLTSSVKVYTVVVSDLANDKCADTLTHIVTSVANPLVPEINGGIMPVLCDSSTVLFEVSNKQDSTHYFWYTSPALPISGQQAPQSNITFYGIDSAIVYVHAINKWGCTATQSEKVYLSQAQAPSVMIREIADLTDSTLIAIATPDSTLTYQWGYDGANFSPNPISGATTQDLLLNSVQNSADYWVIVTDTLTHCSTKTYFVAPLTNTDIRDINGADAKVSLYPNPSSDRFYIQIKSSAVQAWSIEIMDVNGNLIERTETIKDQNINREMNASSWAAGAYFIRVISASGDSKVLKLIRE